MSKSTVVELERGVSFTDKYGARISLLERVDWLEDTWEVRAWGAGGRHIGDKNMSVDEIRAYLLQQEQGDEQHLVAP